MESREIKKPYKPKKFDAETSNFQHIKILDCNKPVSRIIFECWHCKQGLLSEVESQAPTFLEVTCPSCGRTALRLTASKVLSTTPISSPWGQ
ncbi:hypothetical protein [Calothrix sp. NIES-2098]|uniref:hypothetical protein n=1 Tax=Calothrix sp. NIES-2098 TaxID=1954171 RepID=UPI000BBC84FA